MNKNILVDGIIDLIKEIREATKCPFCDEKLEFNMASKSRYFGDTDRICLICRKCQLEFSLNHKKKDKWVLSEVRRSPNLR